MLTKQEMLNRAVRGLRSQGWELAREVDTGRCAYLISDGRRCAWGWVDPDATVGRSGSVRELWKAEIGLAKTLIGSDLKFACELQRVHDLTPIAIEDSDIPESIELQKRFRAFAQQWDLVFPED